MQLPNDNLKEKPKKIRSSGRRVLIHLFKAVSAAAVLAAGFWLLWNLAGVPLLTVPPLTYWQALGAMLLIGLLLRISLFAAGRHRGPHHARPAHAGCSSSRCRPGNGSRDI